MGWDGVEGAGGQDGKSKELVVSVPESHTGGPQGPKRCGQTMLTPQR